MNVDAIKFRMYHTGSVGDCLLLLFMKKEEISFSMLIDCGGWQTDDATITNCVKDINSTCKGKLDLLVVTHQHLDHISGFNEARAEFDKIKVNQVWMSWIEDETDPVAKILKKQYGKKMAELKRLADKSLRQINRHTRSGSGILGMNKRLDNKRMSVENTLALIDFEEGKMSVRGKAARATNDTAMNYVKKKGKLQFRVPGEVISGLPQAEGIKFFILGPPRDEDMRYFKIHTKEEEMYSLQRKAAEENTSQEPVTEDIIENIVETGILLQDGESPFEERYACKTPVQFSTAEEKKDYAWRNIEGDWLDSAAAIAMRATSLTNNTSLAMAIEFEGSGKVILLPGDAQSGNWMGWHKPDVMKSLKKKGGKTTDELLHDTVFYKVGHHGSHNGTASLSGLDMMKSSDLVAFMPLVENKVPAVWQHDGNFPAKKLYNVLKEKTRGRLVRTDMGLINDARALAERKKLSAKEKKELEKQLVKGKNYYEYTIMS